MILIPVNGRTEPFGLGAWVSQSKVNFERYAADEEMAPTFGWLVNRMAHYDETTFLSSAASSFTTGGEITVDGGMAHA